MVNRNFININQIGNEKAVTMKLILEITMKKWYKKHVSIYIKSRKNASIRLYNKYLVVESEGTSEVVFYRQDSR